LCILITFLTDLSAFILRLTLLKMFLSSEVKTVNTTMKITEEITFKNVCVCSKCLLRYPVYVSKRSALTTVGSSTECYLSSFMVFRLWAPYL
jgi:hypothetical protein